MSLLFLNRQCKYWLGLASHYLKKPRIKIIRNWQKCWNSIFRNSNQFPCLHCISPKQKNLQFLRRNWFLLKQIIKIRLKFKEINQRQIYKLDKWHDFSIISYQFWKRKPRIWIISTQHLEPKFSLRIMSTHNIIQWHFPKQSEKVWNQCKFSNLRIVTSRVWKIEHAINQEVKWMLIKRQINSVDIGGKVSIKQWLERKLLLQVLIKNIATRIN